MNNWAAIQQITDIADKAGGFNIVDEGGVFVLDAHFNATGVGSSDQWGQVFAATGETVTDQRWKRALGQAEAEAQQERKYFVEETDGREGHRAKAPPKPYSPSEEERRNHNLTHCPFRSWCEICVAGKSPAGMHKKQSAPETKIPVIEFDYTFGSDRPGDPERKISMLVATDSIHKSVFAVQARRKGSSDEYAMQSFLNYVNMLSLVKAELKCDGEAATIDIRNFLIKKCQSTVLVESQTPKEPKGSLGAG